jgi:hypothetical protein
MINKVTASVEFYFKGEKIIASLDINLDEFMQEAGELPALHPLLAKANKIGPYSYEYEMLEAEEIQFSLATGLVCDYVSDGCFDIEAFKIAWLEISTIKLLKNIAQRHMSVDNLDNQSDLKNALLEAFQLGLSQK